MPSRGYRKGQSDQKVPLPHVIKARLSAEEYRELVVAAQGAAITQSRYIREVLAAHLERRKPELPHGRQPSSQLLRDLARIGNNLNQLAKRANEGLLPIASREILSCLTELNALAARY